MNILIKRKIGLSNLAAKIEFAFEIEFEYSITTPPIESLLSPK